MAQASKRTRQLRRLKRERTLLHRMNRVALDQRDQARLIAKVALQEIDNLNKKLNPETSIQVINDPEVENNNSTV